MSGGFITGVFINQNFSSSEEGASLHFLKLNLNGGEASAFTSELKPLLGGGGSLNMLAPPPAVLGDYLVCSRANLMDVFVGYFLNVWAEEVKHLFIYICTTDRNCLIKEINIR